MLSQLMLISVAIVSANGYNISLHFGHSVEKGRVMSSAVTDISGLGASRVHPGILYAHNDADAGFQKGVFALDPKTGHVLATMPVRGADAHDWEDLSVGPCDQDVAGWCIYVADLGSNGRAHTIYKIREPLDLINQTLEVEDSLTFTWEGDRGESVAVDSNGDVYAMSCEDGGNALFAKLPRSAWGSANPVHIRRNAGVRMHLDTNHNDPGGADFSPDGRYLLVKTLKHVFCYDFGSRRDYVDAFSNAKQYTIETYAYSHAGDPISAVTWSVDATGFYMMPEGTHPLITWYPVSEVGDNVR